MFELILLRIYAYQNELIRAIPACAKCAVNPGSLLRPSSKRQAGRQEDRAGKNNVKAQRYHYGRFN